MAKKAKKSAVKKTSTKNKSTSRTKAVSKTKAKPAKVATKNKATAKVQTSYSTKIGTSDLRVTEYKLFTEDSVRNLEDQVNYHIRKGWSPVGGVVLHGTNTFTQTMVRHES